MKTKKVKIKSVSEHRNTQRRLTFMNDSFIDSMILWEHEYEAFGNPLPKDVLFITVSTKPRGGEE